MAECTMTEYVSVWLNDTAGYPTFVCETKEQVVRCKDCHYCQGEIDNHDGKGYLFHICMRPDGDGDYLRMDVEPDGYCKWGERKVVE